MPPKPTNRKTSPIELTQSIIALASFLTPCRNPIIHNLLLAASLVRFDAMLKREAKERQSLENLRQKAEETADLHILIDRWMCGDHPVFGFPSEQWKRLHPQMFYHLARIRHREQHELLGGNRLPACKEKDRATIAFLNWGGDVEEMRWWPKDLEAEFLNSLVWQWKNDTGI